MQEELAEPHAVCQHHPGTCTARAGVAPASHTAAAEDKQEVRVLCSHTHTGTEPSRAFPHHVGFTPVTGSHRYRPLLLC